MVDDVLLKWLDSQECCEMRDRNGGLTVPQIVKHAYGVEPTPEEINRLKRNIGETMRYAGYGMVRIGSKEERVRVYTKAVTGNKRTLGYFIGVVHKGRSGQYQAQGRFYHEELAPLRAWARLIATPNFRINIYANDVRKKDRYVPIEVIEYDPEWHKKNAALIAELGK